MYSNVLLPDEFLYGERMSKVTSNIIRLKRFTDVDLSWPLGSRNNNSVIVCTTVNLFTKYELWSSLSLIFELSCLQCSLILFSIDLRWPLHNILTFYLLWCSHMLSNRVLKYFFDLRWPQTTFDHQTIRFLYTLGWICILNIKFSHLFFFSYHVYKLASQPLRDCRGGRQRGMGIMNSRWKKKIRS